MTPLHRMPKLATSLPPSPWQFPTLDFGSFVSSYVQLLLMPPILRALSPRVATITSSMVESGGLQCRCIPTASFAFLWARLIFLLRAICNRAWSWFRWRVLGWKLSGRSLATATMTRQADTQRFILTTSGCRKKIFLLEKEADSPSRRFLFHEKIVITKSRVALDQEEFTIAWDWLAIVSARLNWWRIDSEAELLLEKSCPNRVFGKNESDSVEFKLIRPDWWLF